MQTVVIAGVGLIGGSFALALKAAGFSGRILGVSGERTINSALARGVIDEGATLDAAAPLADLIYLASPIHVILETIPRLAGRLKPGAIVTDAGSTKAEICALGASALGPQFLGGHPMAGKESRGVEVAEASLFAGRPYLLTPASAAALNEPAAAELLAWLERIGAVTRVLTPEQHDRVVSLSSHLPQLLSTTLAAALGAHQARADVAAAAGPGLVDSTRLAMGSWPIWNDILTTNRPAILAAMDYFAAEWAAVRAQFESGSLQAEFERGDEFARSVRKPSQGKAS